MCGIFCVLSHRSFVRPLDTTEHLLQARGPDAANQIQFTYDKNNVQQGSRPVHITCYSTVLSLRGSITVNQPYQSDDGNNVLCWNGEAWTIQTSQTTGNDTILVHELLQSVMRDSDHATNRSCLTRTREVAKAMSEIAGPYAFAFFDKTLGEVYFGRDFLGRRSLLVTTSEDGNDLILSSVADLDLRPDWTEVEADGVYCIDLNQTSDNNRPEDNVVLSWGKFKVVKFPYVTQTTSSTASVIPTLSLNRQNIPLSTPLDCDSESVSRLDFLLRESLKLRILNIPDPPKPRGYVEGQRKSSLAVLFSGGLDCTVLARISHDLFPISEPIDLLNVAFENPRVHQSAVNGTPNVNVYELCPDRTTGRASYAELCQVCPEREWRFIAINIPYSETQEHRQRVIALMHPHNTEMDLSISLALYFAARGVGHFADNSTYKSPARVLLSGLGADELFAGYIRHATAFNKNGYTGLLDELELDIGRLGKRNLGRDDRVISNWAREARFPYLDEKIVGWALSVPVTEKCGFGLPNSQISVLVEDISCCLDPEKKVLRCLALRLGMRNVAKEKKRAIQFGARTAKMETGKTKGTQLLTG